MVEKKKSCFLRGNYFLGRILLEGIACLPFILFDEFFKIKINIRSQLCARMNYNSCDNSLIRVELDSFLPDEGSEIRESF